MTSNVLKAIVAAAIAGGALAAHASTASASLSNLQFSFVDLDPNDGIAPSASSISPIYANVEVSRGSDNLTQSAYAAPYSVSVRQDAANAGEVNTPAGIAGASMSAISRTGALDQYSDVSLGGSFSLAPGTKLVLSADASVDVQTSSLQPNAIGSAYLSLGTPGSFQDYYLNAGSGSTHLETFLVNNTASVMQGYFGAGTNTEALAVSAVPEPGEAALLLSGLGVLGLAVARRRAVRKG